MAVLAGGAVVLIPSLWYLLRVFKGSGQAAESADRTGQTT